MLSISHHKSSECITAWSLQHAICRQSSHLLFYYIVCDIFISMRHAENELLVIHDAWISSEIGIILTICKYLMKKIHMYMICHVKEEETFYYGLVVLCYVW